MDIEPTIKTPEVLEIIYDGYCYDVTEWVKKHPGGKIIEFFTKPGEDASIVIKQFHHRSWERVLSIMKGLKRRPALEIEIAGNLDSVTFARHKALTDDYMNLYKEVLDEGLFEPSTTHIFLRVAEIAVLIAIGFMFHFSPNPYMVIPTILIAGICGPRSSYLAHESGHRAFTGNITIDKIYESFAFGFINGMSSGYWNSQHNRHHAFPQRLEHDGDLQTLPLLAFNAKVVKDKKVGQSFWIQNQAYLFYTMDAFLVGMVWRFYYCPKYVIHKRMYMDLFFITLHHVYLYLLGIWGYFITAWISSIILMGNFSLSHTHTPVSSAEETKHWIEYSLDHTINVNPSILTDWFMGNLNYQIEHHLFPSIPDFRLKKITKRVRALAQKHNLSYKCVSYWEAVRLLLQNLNQVSQDVNISFGEKDM